MGCSNMGVPQKESGVGASVLPAPTSTGRIATLKYFEGQDFELHSNHHSDIARKSTCVPGINDSTPTYAQKSQRFRYDA